MAKKRKSKKHKGKALERRKKQYEGILSRATAGHFDEIENDDSVNMKKMIARDKAPKVLSPSYIRKDLTMVLYLLIIFVFVVTVLFLLEVRYDYLSPLANGLMEFLLK